jgi:hypothetical protein
LNQGEDEWQEAHPPLVNTSFTTWAI